MNVKQDKVYCEKCNKKVGFNIIKENLEKYKGTIVNVEQNIGVCEICNEKLYIPYLEDDNLDRLYSKYRKLTGIVSPKDIIDFRARYNISQRELVSILDWGKMTINRYEKGSLPNQSHSDILKLIIENESYFMEKVKDAYENKRISEKTYNSMYLSIENENELDINNFIISRLRHNPSIHNGFMEFDLYKLENLIGYISSKVTNLYKTSLNKYLWYIDFSNYKYNLKSMTGLRYIRYTFGPIIEGKNYELILNLDDKFEKDVVENNLNETTKIKSKHNFDLGVFSKDEIVIIDNVIKLFKDKSVSEISNLSHNESAWIENNNNELISYEYAHALKIF